MKLLKGDTVKIVIGKDSGKTGTVEKTYTKEGKVLITGMNQYKKHVKARSAGEKSEIITITKPLPVSNVALICPQCKAQTRVGYVIEKDVKSRVCRKCEKRI